MTALQRLMMESDLRSRSGVAGVFRTMGNAVPRESYVQASLFATGVPIAAPACPHTGDVQVQATLAEGDVALCCTCGDVVASRWPR